MTTVAEIFATDVTRDIPPVIYFQDESPEKLQAEVSEYIITGGYPEGDPRRQRISDGIHEQFVHLLTHMAKELKKPGGSDLPACWISGFFGSGKSSFAKLLGYSLDHRRLPDGRALSDHLLERDDSPSQGELRAAWQAVAQDLDSLAVVFDIGGVARDDEHIHSAVRRKLQSRLGYCALSSAVADFELKLEADGHWSRFEELCQEIHGRPWSQLAKERLVDNHFSAVMHRLLPESYTGPMDWADIHPGGATSRGASVEDTVADIQAMLNRRQPGKTLFLVIDEVSQYIYQEQERMLKLQTFVLELGQKLKGRVWLLATGQQKLEDDLDGGNLTKLKDRFPPRLRVHLAPTNIRDVVHKRLLKKAPARESALRELYQQHGASLRLYGYACDKLTETDFLEVYPLLPGYVDLVMHITSNLRARSRRMKGDDHAIRGLLQLLGEVFRQHRFGERPLGELVTLDQIYDIQHTALDADVQNTMARLQAHEELTEDPFTLKVAKVVALLQQVQEQLPTTAALVAQCLYSAVGAANPLEAVEKSLEKLDSLNLVSRSEKHGYRIQSSAEQEWARERDACGASNQQLAELVKEKLKALLGSVDRPKLRSRPFPLAAFYGDSRGAREERLQSSHDSATLWIDFWYATNQEDRREEKWLKESDSETRRDRLIWVSGATSGLEMKARELLRSREMIARNQSRQASLTEAKKAALHHEQSRRDQLDEQVRGLVADLFLEGTLYFRSRRLNSQRHGATFATLLKGAAEEVLPEIYPHFVELAVTDGELRQLLDPSLVGVSTKFFADGLGLLEHESGKVVSTCRGEVPARLREYIEAENGASGSTLIQRFGGPPWGYAPDLVRASVVGLLRAQQCQIQTPGGEPITSYRDPGVQDLFLKERDFKNAEVTPAGERPIKPGDLIKIRKFFEEITELDFENENEALAEAAFTHLRRFAEEHMQFQQRLQKLAPLRPVLPPALAQLESTLTRCLPSHHVEKTLVAVKKHLDSLRDGIQQLRIYRNDLTDEIIDQVRRAQRLCSVEGTQLLQLEPEAEVQNACQAVGEQLALDCPWRDIGSLKPHLQLIETRYRETRARLLEKQEQQLDQLMENLKLRHGFSQLDPDQADSVLRLVRDRRLVTTAEAVSPDLIVLRDSVPPRLQEGAEQAHRRLEELLADGGVQVITVRTGLQGRELATPDDVENLLQELRERLLTQLQGKSRIRLL